MTFTVRQIVASIIQLRMLRTNFQRSPSNYSTAIFFSLFSHIYIRSHSSVPVCPVHIVQFSVSVFSHCLSTVNFQLILIPIYCKFYSIRFEQFSISKFSIDSIEINFFSQIIRIVRVRSVKVFSLEFCVRKKSHFPIFHS